MTSLDSPSLYWAAGVVVGLPLLLIALTEWHQSLARKNSPLARPAFLLRTYVIPPGRPVGAAGQRGADAGAVHVGAGSRDGVRLRGVGAAAVRAQRDHVRGRTARTWRQRIPGIFLDVTRFVLIGIGLAVIFSYVWGVRVGGLSPRWVSPRW